MKMPSAILRFPTLAIKCSAIGVVVDKVGAFQLAAQPIISTRDFQELIPFLSIS